MIYQASLSYIPQRLDEISLHQGDHVCIYQFHGDCWAQGHNISQDSFGFFPVKGIKRSGLENYQRLTAQQIRMKQLCHLFHNSDSEQDSAFYASHLECQLHLSLESQISNILTDYVIAAMDLIDQLKNFIEVCSPSTLPLLFLIPRR